MDAPPLRKHPESIYRPHSELENPRAELLRAPGAFVLMGSRTNKMNKKKPVSRQRRWQLARVAEGRCSVCGKPRRHYATVCDPCALKERRRERAREGTSPWKPGGLGRRPLVPERERAGTDRRSARPTRRAAGTRTRH